MSENNSLQMPYLCTIPNAVLCCESLPANAKIHFGCLAGLAQRNGYCWATDIQLAEMHGVSVSQIVRWHDKLEAENFIKRETENVSYRDSEGRLLWKKKRKIYVGDGFSKKDCETSKNAHINDICKNEHIDDMRKNAHIKSKPLNRDISKKKEEPAKQAVVVSPKSALDELNISRSDKKKYLDKYDEETLEKAVKRVLGWKSRESDSKALCVVFKYWDDWNDVLHKEQQQSANVEILEKLTPLDTSRRSFHKADEVQINILSKSIEVTLGNKCEVLSVDESKFIEKLKDLLEKYGVDYESYL